MTKERRRDLWVVSARREVAVGTRPTVEEVTTRFAVSRSTAQRYLRAAKLELCPKVRRIEVLRGFRGRLTAADVMAQFPVRESAAYVYLCEARRVPADTRRSTALLRRRAALIQEYGDARVVRPPTAKIARRFGVSRATAQRDLAEAGVRFRQAGPEARRAWIMRRLAAGDRVAWLDAATRFGVGAWTAFRDLRAAREQVRCAQSAGRWPEIRHEPQGAAPKEKEGGAAWQTDGGARGSAWLSY